MRAGLQTKLVWSRTTHCAMARLVVAELNAAEDGDGVNAAPIVTCDATGAEVDVEGLAADVWNVVDGSCDGPPLPPPSPLPPQQGVSCAFASVDWVLENPLNCLWLVLFTRHPRFAKWHSVTLSYCKLRRGATSYRKTTRFLSSLPSATTYPPPCSPNAPCAAVREHGRHSHAIGDMAPERSVLGYYARSHVPPALVADFLEAVVAQRLVNGIKRLLLVDLCAGYQSARVGVNVYRRRAVWAQRRNAGCEIGYVSVDSNGDCAPLLHLDLLSVGMHEVLAYACRAVGWEEPAAVAVFVWFSPPCETVPSSLLNPQPVASQRWAIHAGACRCVGSTRRSPSVRYLLLILEGHSGKPRSRHMLPSAANAAPKRATRTAW